MSPARETFPPGPVVKICGLTRLEDVVYARDLGVWAVGLVFAPSPRRVDAERARGLLTAAGLGRHGAGTRGADRAGDGGAPPLAVGVFTDSEPARIAQTVEEVGLDAVQLHGDMGPGVESVRAALGDEGRSVPVIQAVPVGPQDDSPEDLRRAVEEASALADVVLLDTKVAGRFGGTGQSFPWGLVSEAVSDGAHGARLLVAGGIGPDNVLEALAGSGAWGVDVSSGVELSPGVKESLLMRQLVERVEGGEEA